MNVLCYVLTPEIQMCVLYKLCQRLSGGFAAWRETVYEGTNIQTTGNRLLPY